MTIGDILIGNLYGFLGAWGVAYLAVLWFAIIAWTYRDATARIKTPSKRFLSALLVIAFFIPGVLIYFLLRPRETIEEQYLRTLQEESLLRGIEAHELIEDE